MSNSNNYRVRHFLYKKVILYWIIAKKFRNIDYLYNYFRERYVRGITNFLRRKEVRTMSISTYLLETIRNQFEVFCIRVLQNEARDCYRELDYMNKKMVLFSDLSEEQFNSFSSIQEYDSDFYLFEINGYKVRVRDHEIGEAISKLPKKKQDIILLSFFLDMTEADIAKYLKLGQSTVHYHKANSLRELRKLMEEKQSEKNK